MWPLFLLPKSGLWIQVWLYMHVLLKDNVQSDSSKVQCHNCSSVTCHVVVPASRRDGWTDRQWINELKWHTITKMIYTCKLLYNSLCIPLEICFYFSICRSFLSIPVYANYIGPSVMIDAKFLINLDLWKVPYNNWHTLGSGSTFFDKRHTVTQWVHVIWPSSNASHDRLDFQPCWNDRALCSLLRILLCFKFVPPQNLLYVCFCFAN